MKKGAFCLLLAIILVFAIIPTSVFAATAATGKCGDEGSDLVWSIDYDGTLTISGTGAMKYFGETVAGWHKYGKAINTVVVGEGVTNIGGYAFWECPNISSVSLPSTLNSIDRFAFIDCARLDSIDIPTGVETIDMGAFYGCKALDRIVIPDTTTYLGSYAFANCTDLSIAVVPASVTSIGSNLFLNCSDLSIYCVRNSMMEMFASKNNLKFVYAASHKMIHVSKISATCVSSGTIEYWHCTDCNKNYADSLGTKEVTNLNVLPIPTAHKFSQGKCIYCGKEGVQESNQTGISNGSFGSSQGGFPFPNFPGMDNSVSGWTYSDGGFEWQYYWGYIAGRAEGSSSDDRSPEDLNIIDTVPVGDSGSGNGDGTTNITNNNTTNNNTTNNYYDGDTIIVSDPVESISYDFE